MNSMKGLAAGIAILLWLAGCAPKTRTDIYPIGGPEQPTATDPRPVYEPQRADRPTSSDGAQQTNQPLPAVAALSKDARDARKRGDLEKAAVNLERALRLDSDNAKLWHQLAQVRLDQLRTDQAEALALKSNQFAGDDLLLQRANWNLIAQARRLSGDEQGAEAARSRARGLIPE